MTAVASTTLNIAERRPTYRDVAVRYLSGDRHPDHDTIASFRKSNRQLFEQCFVEVLALARQVGVLTPISRFAI